MEESEHAVRLLRRKDGRGPYEMRGRELKLSISSQFDGSAFYCQGGSAVQVNINGPVTASMKASAGADAFQKCSIRIRVQHLRPIPVAGGAERLNQNERRAIQQSQYDVHELITLLEHAVGAVFFAERFPRCVLALDVCIFEDDGALAATCVNAVMAAMLDAGLPCRTTMAAVSVSATSTRLDMNTPHRQDLSTQNRRRSILFLLDPTASEERGSSSLFAEVKSEGVGCLAHGVFVFSNPASGGGLLASHIHRAEVACQQQKHQQQKDQKNDNEEAVKTSNGNNLESEEVAAAGGNLSAAQWLEMATLAEKASSAVFSFFRQCNVPLE